MSGVRGCVVGFFPFQWHCEKLTTYNFTAYFFCFSNCVWSIKHLIYQNAYSKACLVCFCVFLPDTSTYCLLEVILLFGWIFLRWSGRGVWIFFPPKYIEWTQFVNKIVILHRNGPTNPKEINNLFPVCEWYKWAILSYVLTFDWVSKWENSKARNSFRESLFSRYLKCL